MIKKDVLFTDASRVSCKERAMRYTPFKITEVEDSTTCVGLALEKGKFSLFFSPLYVLYVSRCGEPPEEIVSR